MRPRGPRSEGPPILIGAAGERTLRLTAPYAELWNMWTINTPERLATFQDRVDAACVEVGRLNGAARIVIEDDGPGLPPDLLDQVFEPFFSADPSRRQDIRGAGLGLTIAREIIQRAGGTISISNRAAGGLRQVVELPQAAEVA